MNNYYDKYFKYKMKYLNLKNQVGKGSISTPENIIYNMLELYHYHIVSSRGERNLLLLYNMLRVTDVKLVRF